MGGNKPGSPYPEELLTYHYNKIVKKFNTLWKKSGGDAKLNICPILKYPPLKRKR